jgi:hypothetical protein
MANGGERSLSVLRRRTTAVGSTGDPPKPTAPRYFTLLPTGLLSSTTIAALASPSRHSPSLGSLCHESFDYLLLIIPLSRPPVPATLPTSPPAIDCERSLAVHTRQSA